MKYKITLFFIMMTFVKTQPHQAPVRQSIHRIPFIEPVAAEETYSGEPGRIIHYSNRNTTQFTLIDSSKNGYGLWGANLRPLYVSPEGWLIAYKKWQGESGSSGVIGTATSVDGLNWIHSDGINISMGTGGHISAIGAGGFPYIFWQEHFNSGFYYAYNQSGWNEEPWSDPISFYYNLSEDGIWMYTPDVSFISEINQYLFNVVASTDSSIIVFRSQYDSTGSVTFDAGQTVMNTQLEPAFISSASPPVLDINENGIGYVAITMLLPDSVNLFNPPRTLNFSLTEDYGASWSEEQSPGVYFTLPLDIFDQMIQAGEFNPVWFWDEECTDNFIIADQIFAAFNFDMRVDSQGDPHFLIPLIATDGVFIYPGHTSNAVYHFTIDHNYIDNPGEPNTPTGWNYSKVMDISDMTRWQNENGDSYWLIVSPSLAVSEENDNVMYAVISGPVSGGDVMLDDNNTPLDPCDDIYGYPYWNEEIFVVKSEDGGQTWWCPVNVSQTIPGCSYNDNNELDCGEAWICPDGITQNRPDEIAAHAGTGATDTRVNIVFQTPDWCTLSTTGDLSSFDHKNRIYSGWVELNEEDTSYCDGLIAHNSGDVNSDGALDVLDIVGMVNYIVAGNPLPCEFCGDMDYSGSIDVLDIVIAVNLIIGG